MNFLKVVTLLNLLVIVLVLYLRILVLYTLMSFLDVLSTSGITQGCASGVSTFLSQFSFLTIYPFLGVTAEFLLG